MTAASVVWNRLVRAATSASAKAFASCAARAGLDAFPTTATSCEPSTRWLDTELSTSFRDPRRPSCARTASAISGVRTSRAAVSAAAPGAPSARGSPKPSKVASLAGSGETSSSVRAS